MTIESQKVIITTWETLEAGCQVFGYSEASAISRALDRDRILGARKEHGRWRSHPEGLVGPIADVRQSFALPKGTGGVKVDVCSGSVSGQVFARTMLEPGRRFPLIEIWAEPNSGVIAKITCVAS